MPACFCSKAGQKGAPLRPVTSPFPRDAAGRAPPPPQRSGDVGAALSTSVLRSRVALQLRLPPPHPFSNKRSAGPSSHRPPSPQPGPRRCSPTEPFETPARSGPTARSPCRAPAAASPWAAPTQLRSAGRSRCSFRPAPRLRPPCAGRSGPHRESSSVRLRDYGTQGEKRSRLLQLLAKATNC